MRTYLACLFVISLIIGSSTVVWSDDKEGKVADLVKDAKVTAEQAIKTAMEKVPGTVVEAELDTGSVARRLRKEIHELYGHLPEVHVITSSGLRKGTRYVIRVVKDGEGLARQTGLIDQRGRPVRGLPASVVSGGAADAEAAQAPQFTGTFPVVQADHLGASTYIEKGWSLISLGDHAGAIQSLSRALQLAPGDTQAQSFLGWAQMLHEDYDDALATFSRVLMKEPANSLARINVGFICLKKRIFGEAIEHLSRRSASTTTARRPSTPTSTLGWSISSGRCSRTRSRSSGRRCSSVPT